MKTPIRIYYHVYAVNHYLDIIKEQIQTIIDCGLYDECEDINVGFLGSEDALKAAMEYFKQFPKVKIGYFSTNGSEYEFATLKILKRDCDQAKAKFYGFYIHSKAVSYPTTHEAFLGGRFWRHYLMDFVIKKWRNNYKALDLKYMGYDICGPKVVPARVSPSNRTHISGTMFAFNSEYIRSLCKIEMVNNKDRFESEQWPSSGQPIIYTPCQLFVDYNVRHESYDEFMKNYKDLPDFCI